MIHTVWVVFLICYSVSNQSPYEKCIKVFDRKTDIVNNAVAWSKVSFIGKPNILYFLHFWNVCNNLKRQKQNVPNIKMRTATMVILYRFTRTKKLILLAVLFEEMVMNKFTGLVYGWIAQHVNLNGPINRVSIMRAGKMGNPTIPKERASANENRIFSDVRLSLTRSWKLRSHQSQCEWRMEWSKVYLAYGLHLPILCVRITITATTTASGRCMSKWSMVEICRNLLLCKPQR